MLVVANTSPLIALDRIGKLEVLRHLYGTVLRPQSVVDELNAGQGAYDISRMLRDAEWIVTKPDPPVMALRKELGAGETAAIALATSLQADLVVLDDLQARLVAASLGLRITGTLGVLLAAQRIGLLADTMPAISQLQEAGFRISVALLEKCRSLGAGTENA